MYYPKPELVESLRKRFPSGTRVELVIMNDPYIVIPPGTLGSVTGIDDTGTIFVKWDTGTHLGVVYGVDVVRKVEI